MTGTTALTELCQRTAAGPGVGLLVSVRKAAEAADALAGGADVIDVKEPRRGALGRADAATMTAVIDRVAGRSPVTAALGELSEAAGVAGLPEGLAAAKVGLAGTGGSDWLAGLRKLAHRLSQTAPLVPVAYADSGPASAPPVERVLDAAIDLGTGWMVIDTWDKQGDALFDCIGADSLHRLIDRGRRAGVSIVLAGRLSGTDLPVALACRPALIGARGAVCDGGRTGTVSTARVQSIAQRIAKDRRMA